MPKFIIIMVTHSKKHVLHGGSTRGLQSPCVCAIPLQLNRAISFTAKCMRPAKKKNLIRESWLVLPLLSRGNAHIVHPIATAVWIVWQVLGWQQSPKLFLEVVTGFYRRYFVLCKVFLLEKMCIFCFQNCCMWIFWQCSVQLAMCVSTICQARNWVNSRKNFFRGCQPGHWDFFRQSCGDALRKWISYWNQCPHCASD